MDVGIIGAGRLGQAMARTALRAGRSVLIANSRGPESLASLVAALVAGARLVKAANTLSAEDLESDPHEAGGQRVIFISGDDAGAKAKVVALFQDAGFAPIDLGDLATGGALQQIHHPLAGVNLVQL